jgi:hypothetical protein
MAYDYDLLFSIFAVFTSVHSIYGVNLGRAFYAQDLGSLGTAKIQIWRAVIILQSMRTTYWFLSLAERH